MGAAFEALRQRYPVLAKDLLRPLLTLLIEARSACAGDMETALILLVLAIRAAEHPEFAEVPFQTLERGDLARVPCLAMNVRSLAESTGMPKETVRRKVQMLVRLGLVERSGRNLAYTPAALRALFPVQVAIIRQALANHSVVAPTLVSPVA